MHKKTVVTIMLLISFFNDYFCDYKNIFFIFISFLAELKMDMSFFDFSGRLWTFVFLNIFLISGKNKRILYMNSSDYKYYFLLIFSIVFFESIAQYHIKKSKLKNNYIYLFVAVFSYSIVCLLLDKCYDFNGVGITNFVWSVLSVVSMLIIGIVMFNETITKYDIIGIAMSISGLYLIFVYDH